MGQCRPDGRYSSTLAQLACNMESRLTGDNTAAQCPSEDCGGTKAYFYMVQIRSADEPMTAFFKVCIFCVRMTDEADDGTP